MKIPIATVIGAILIAIATLAHAENASVDPARTHLKSGDVELDVTLGLTQAVPFRVATRHDPAQLILDFKGVDWGGIDKTLFGSNPEIRDLRYGLIQLGWSRMVIDLMRPAKLSFAELRTSRAPELHLSLEFVDPDRGEVSIGTGAAWQRDDNFEPAMGDGPLLVAIDAGHGGVDPGAVRNGVAEKDIALAFSKVLRDGLLQTGEFSVFLTRSNDEYVSLRDRVRRAQAAEADVFLSIHANTVTEGDASGATVYSLSETASDAATAKLAELENRADISAGLDLTTEEDDIAKVLIDMARTETNARSAHFAAALVEGMKNATGIIQSRPHRSAGFKVLKAPDMPSLLLELGFLSNARDRRNMQDGEWLHRASLGVVEALKNWSASDRVLSKLVMK